MWRDILGFEGYQASDDGRIRNRRRKILKQRKAPGGLLVYLGQTSAMVHNVVAAAFYGKPLIKGYFVRHANRDTLDNSAGNLYYDSPRQPDPPAHSPRGRYCSKGHLLSGDNVRKWGVNNRICVACLEGAPPPRIELPEIL